MIPFGHDGGGPQFGQPDGCAGAHRADTFEWFVRDSSLEGDGFELPVPGRIYSAAMRSQVISRCSSLSPVRRVDDELRINKVRVNAIAPSATEPVPIAHNRG